MLHYIRFETISEKESNGIHKKDREGLALYYFLTDLTHRNSKEVGLAGAAYKNQGIVVGLDGTGGGRVARRCATRWRRRARVGGDSLSLLWIRRRCPRCLSHARRTKISGAAREPGGKRAHIRRKRRPTTTPPPASWRDRRRQCRRASPVASASALGLAATPPPPLPLPPPGQGLMGPPGHPTAPRTSAALLRVVDVEL